MSLIMILSKDAAQNIRLAFDKKEWDKIEELLNKEDKKLAAQIISNTLAAYKTSIYMNNEIKILKTEILSDNWYILKKITYEYFKNGEWQKQTREAYDRGNGATILLYNKEHKTVILTRQFRLPSFINGNSTGMLVEACAGLLDKDNAEDCIKRETEEETGYKIKDVRKIFEAYMSPGSVTEILYFFVAEYSASMKVHEGGGIEDEQEHIEVLEIKFDEAMQMINDGYIKDAKTIMLLQYTKLNQLI
jgi:GDP-mannose pyrophosphatase NudK